MRFAGLPTGEEALREEIACEGSRWGRNSLECSLMGGDEDTELYHLVSSTNRAGGGWWNARIGVLYNP